MALLGSGGYAEYAVAHEATVFPIPDGVDDGAALALIIQGLTAWHLFKTSAKLAEGESVVVISGAGGVGSLAVQLAKPFGAGRVIATASTEEKRAKTLELGADAAVDPAEEDLKGALIEANEGRPVDVVLEMSGGRVFDAVRRRAGAVRADRGLWHREPRAEHARDRPADAKEPRGHRVLADALPRPPRHDGGAARRPVRAARHAASSCRRSARPTRLSEVRRAHEDLQGRRTSGKLLLDPSR